MTAKPTAPRGLFPSPNFVGWRREWRDGRSSRWRAVAGGQTEAEVWRRMCELMDASTGNHFDSLILPGDQEP